MFSRETQKKSKRKKRVLLVVFGMIESETETRKGKNSIFLALSEKRGFFINELKTVFLKEKKRRKY